MWKLRIFPAFYLAFLWIAFLSGPARTMVPSGELSKDTTGLNSLLQANPLDPLLFERRAQALYSQGSYQEALEDFNRSLELGNSYAGIYINRGITYAALSLLDSAINDFERALEFSPDNHIALFDRGLASYMKRLYETALLDFKRVVELDSLYIYAHVQMGHTYLKLDRESNARTSYNIALAIDSTNPISLLGAAHLFHHQEKYESALYMCDLALEKDSRLVDGYIYRSRIYLSKNKIDKGISELTKAIEISPKNADLYYQRANAHMRLTHFGYNESDFVDALDDYEQALNFNPNLIAVYQRRSLIYRKLSQPERALKNINKAILLDSTDGTSYEYRATIYELMGEHLKARDDYSTLLQMDTDSSYGLIWRGTALLELDSLESAIQDFDLAYSLDTAEHKILLLRGNALRRLQRYDEALSDFNRALELKSTWLAARLGRVALYIDQEKYDIATAELKISFESFYSSRKLFPWAKKSPLRSRALILRATVFQKKGNHKKATKDLKESLKIDSESPEAHFMLGQSLESRKHKKKARKSYQAFLKFAGASDSLNVEIAKERLAELNGK